MARNGSAKANLCVAPAASRYPLKVMQAVRAVPNGSTFAIDANPVELNMDNWSEESGGSITGQLGTVWMDYLRGESGTTKLKLTLVSGAIIEATATIQ